MLFLHDYSEPQTLMHIMLGDVTRVMRAQIPTQSIRKRSHLEQQHNDQAVLNVDASND
jgi:hypothetical protein